MPVSDEVGAATRATLMGDHDLAATLAAQFRETDTLPLNLLFDALIMLTAGKRFAEGYTDADIVRYVARVRSGDEIRTAVDPKAAEDVLRRALGKPVSMVKDAEKRTYATQALIFTMFDDLEMDEAGTDAILSEARAITDRWLEELASEAAG